MLALMQRVAPRLNLIHSFHHSYRFLSSFLVAALLLVYQLQQDIIEADLLTILLLQAFILPYVFSFPFLLLFGLLPDVFELDYALYFIQDASFTLIFIVSRFCFVSLRWVVWNQVLSLDLSGVVAVKDQSSNSWYDLSWWIDRSFPFLNRWHVLSLW